MARVMVCQMAVVPVTFTGWKPSPLDRGCTLKTAVAQLRAHTPTPVPTGLPFGQAHPKVTLPVGRKVQLRVEGRDVLVGW